MSIAKHVKISDTKKKIMNKNNPTTDIEKVLQEFKKKFIQDHNRGEERFLRGLFIEEFEDFLRQSLRSVREEALKEGQAYKGKANRESYMRGFNEAREKTLREVDERLFKAIEFPDNPLLDEQNNALLRMIALMKEVGQIRAELEGKV